MSRSKRNDVVTVVGGGLAGSEAAWQLAERGVAVKLYEMRPVVMTAAHVSNRFGELVCSNSLGSRLGSAPGALLKDEMRHFDSLILRAGQEAQIPGGSALTVDRERFQDRITTVLEEHPRIHICRELVTEIPQGPTIIATGPLTHAELSHGLQNVLGETFLSFYDAAAPIVLKESVDMGRAFWGSREGSTDYLNCPLTKSEYLDFYEALIHAEQHPRHDFEADTKFFEGCLPIEELARRGVRTPLFGPMKPIGLSNPFEDGRRPYAVVQLRQDNAAGSLLSMVGFQTNLRWGEQKRVFSLIPALHHAEFVRYGVMHRNTYLKSPKFLEATFATRIRQDLWFAGQMTGVEGYVESAATGIMAAINATRFVHGEQAVIWPRETMMGALAHYVTHTAPEHFQPMNANFGLLPDPPDATLVRDKRERRQMMRTRSLASIESWGHHWGLLPQPERGHAL